MFLLSTFAKAHALELRANKPYKSPTSNEIHCVDANVVVVHQVLSPDWADFTILRFDKNAKGKVVKTSTLDNLFKALDLEKNDMSKFELQCIEDAPGIYIPGKDNKDDDLYVIMTKEGRLIKGYNLTGHGFKIK